MQEHVLIDRFLPVYDLNEVHSVDIASPANGVYEALKSLTPREIPLVQFLMGIRALPARVLSRPSSSGPEAQTVLEQAFRMGFVPLAEESGRELVLGIVGQFWKLSGNIVSEIHDGDEFIAFQREGFAKSAVNFLVEPLDGPEISRVITETRVVLIGDDARRRFSLYWSVVYPGSALIRRTWLRAVKRRAEGRG